MRFVPAAMTEAWLAEDKTGPRAPAVRATIQKVNLRTSTYEINEAAGGDFEHQRPRVASFRSWMGDPSPVIELPNIRSFTWERSTDTEIAEATMVLSNVELVPIGTADDDSRDDFDKTGAMTPNRGRRDVTTYLGDKVYNFKDDFEAYSAARWTTLSGAPAAVDRKLWLAAGDSIRSASQWDLVGSSLMLRVRDLAGDLTVRFEVTSNTFMEVELTAAGLEMRHSVDGTVLETTNTLPAGHEWLRLRLSNDQFIWETSFDTLSWTRRWDVTSVAHPRFKRGRVIINVATGPVQIDAFNLKPSPWAYPTDHSWNNVLVPDRVINSYEGYGVDYSVVPGRDPNLLQSGFWWIDDVEIDEGTGLMTLKMRDALRIVEDLISFPPAIPIEEYPLVWSTLRTETVQARTPTGGSWNKLVRSQGTASSSNDHYVGTDLTNAPYPSYVEPNGAFAGHKAVHVLGDTGYWHSTGQEHYDDFVYWEMDFNSPVDLAGVRLRFRSGPHKVYISVRNATGWIGKKKIPYEVSDDPTSPASVDIGADLPYVKSDIADKGKIFDVVLPRKYSNVRKLRITVTRLISHNVGEHTYKAALRNVSIYSGSFSSLGFAKGPVNKVVGNYDDYTDIAKWICSWGGLWWPDEESGHNVIPLGPGDSETIEYINGPDNKLPRGRAWGFFQRSGTAGQADLTADLFDKKPLLDCLRYVADILGYSLWADEQGAVVWRMPNLWKLGNWVTPAQTPAPPQWTRTNQIMTLNTTEHILSMKVTHSSRNRRERVFVSNTTGKIGVVVQGYKPYRLNLVRVAGWTDQHFQTQRECVVMADMIAARSMFDYRRNQVRICANPAIQVDDQIRILAPVTNETYIHYVVGISSSIDMTSGQWHYDLRTHWLGEEPEAAWAVSVEKVEAATKNYLGLLGVGE